MPLVVKHTEQFPFLHGDNIEKVSPECEAFDGHSDSTTSDFPFCPLKDEARFHWRKILLVNEGKWEIQSLDQAMNTASLLLVSPDVYRAQDVWCNFQIDCHYEMQTHLNQQCLLCYKEQCKQTHSRTIYRIINSPCVMVKHAYSWVWW